MKKILSILLSVLLLISLCTFYPSVQASDSSVSKEVSGLLSALEIVPEGYNYQLNGSMKVTRQEFISLVMKALKVENSVADHTYFSDVDVNGNNTHYINCAVDMGIIKGYGDGTFHPDDLISINDCLKIAVEACGYGVIAQQSGGYPIGYLTVAADTKISKNLTGDYRRYAVMEDARFIIYNMLHAERVNIYTADGMVNGTTDSGKSILSDIYNVYRSSGIVTGTQFTRLTSDSKLKEGYIEIGGELFLQNKTDYSKFLGYNVSFYYMIEEEVKVLVYVSPSSYNHDIMYKAQDIANYSNRQYTFYDGTKKHYEKVPLTADVIYNGQVLLGDYDESVLKPDNGSVTMIDNNEDGIYDVIKVINKRIIVVDSVDVNEGIIYDRLTTNGFPLQTQYKNNRITLTNQLGTAIELTDVKRDGVVEAEISIDGTLANIVVHESSVNGILSGTVQEENEILYKVDDIAYPINNYLALYIKNKGLKFSFGSRYKFLLTTDGEIAWLIAEAEAEGNYGCLIKAATDNTMNNILNLKILTTEDRIGIFECADKIKINEQPRMKSKEALGFLKSLLVDSSTGEAVPLVIYYKMDDENKINYIETPNASSTTTNESLRISGTAMNITTTKGNVSSVGGSVNFDKDTVMFMIPEDLENTQDKNLRAVKINEYARDATVFKLIVGYSREPDAVISRVILNRETAGDSYDWSIFMVTDVLKGLTEKEEEKYILKGLLNGTEKEFWVDDDDAYIKPNPFSGSTVPAPPAKGDLLRLAISPSGEIRSIAVVYSPSRDKWHIDQNPTGSGIPFMESPENVENLENYYLRSPNGGHYRATLRVFEANVYSKNDTHIRAVNTMYDLTDPNVIRMIENAEIGLENHQANATNVFVYHPELKTNEVYVRGDMGSITSLKGQGKASRVVICTVESKPVAIVVYPQMQ